MSTYRATRADQRTADDYLANHLPCRFCGRMEDRETLGNLGARCQACYDAYIGRDVNAPQLTTAEKVAVLQKLRGLFGSGQPLRRWADRLRFIEEQRDGMLPAAKHLGRKQAEPQRMTPYQREAWREVLGTHTTPEENP